MGYTHPPDASHDVAPHAPAMHAEAQQSVRHAPLAHAPLPAHGCPRTRRHAVPPPVQLVFAEHPVLGAVQVVPHALPLAHAKPPTHAAAAPTTHVPEGHVAAGVRLDPAHDAPAHDAHTPPLLPQAPADVPGTHIPVVLPLGMLQQPPLHGFVAEHVVRHACVVVSHERPVAQSDAGSMQPQVPPNAPVLGTHALPTLMPAHATHAPPVDPHAVADCPCTHTPNAPPSTGLVQHPPLHVCVALHAVVHAWVVVSHAIPWAQSAAVLQPHEVALLMHAEPALAATHVAHVPPTLPHEIAAVLLAAHVPALQHVPLHARPVAQVVLHVPVAVSHASPTGHWLDAVHPPSRGTSMTTSPFASRFVSATVSRPVSNPASIASIPVAVSRASVVASLPSRSAGSKRTISSHPGAIDAHNTAINSPRTRLRSDIQSSQTARSGPAV